MSDFERPGEDSPVEIYLDELLLALPGGPREVRNQLAEAEAHLRDATAEGIAQGLDELQAEAAAVARFGSTQLIAATEAQAQRRPLTALLRDCILSAWWLAAIGAIAVGVSGLLAALTTAAWGATFTAGRPSIEQLNPADCARWMANTRLSICSSAATADWTHDTVVFRIGFGLLGLAAFAGWALWHRGERRRSRLDPTMRLAGLSSTVTDAVALTAFGTAGVWLAGQTIDTLVVAAGHGAGQWLSAAPVALVIGGFFGARLLRDPQNHYSPPPGGILSTSH